MLTSAGRRCLRGGGEGSGEADALSGVGVGSGEVEDLMGR